VVVVTRQQERVASTSSDVVTAATRRQAVKWQQHGDGQAGKWAILHIICRWQCRQRQPCRYGRITTPGMPPRRRCVRPRAAQRWRGATLVVTPKRSRCGRKRCNGSRQRVALRPQNRRRYAACPSSQRTSAYAATPRQRTKVYVRASVRAYPPPRRAQNRRRHHVVPR